MELAQRQQRCHFHFSEETKEHFNRQTLIDNLPYNRNILIDIWGTKLPNDICPRSRSRVSKGQATDVLGHAGRC